MWMNLDKLPAGTSMYTVYVTDDPEGTARSAMSVEEVDVIGPSHCASWGQLVVNDSKVHPTGENASQYIVASYGEDVRIIGVVNQSRGSVIYDAFAAGDETGANDL